MNSYRKVKCNFKPSLFSYKKVRYSSLKQIIIISLLENKVPLSIKKVKHFAQPQLLKFISFCPFLPPSPPHTHPNHPTPKNFTNGANIFFPVYKLFPSCTRRKKNAPRKSKQSFIYIFFTIFVYYFYF